VVLRPWANHTRDSQRQSPRVYRGAALMRICLVIGCLLAAMGSLAVADVPYAAGGTTSAVVTRNCGSLRLGSDGRPPGPSRITAKNVTCRFARGLALRGSARGWHCHLTMGIMFACRPTQGRGMVTFLGE
jgi:hypothetical protein